jgi:hypothetical protein
MPTAEGAALRSDPRWTVTAAGKSARLLDQLIAREGRDRADARNDRKSAANPRPRG